VDDKLMINSLLSENYFLDDDWRFENKMNITEEVGEKAKRRTLKSGLWIVLKTLTVRLIL
jgi:hypothetical protein